jgi:hypothetical protein
LFDFDVVVIRPYLLVGNRPAGWSNIESHEYSQAIREVVGKAEDIGRLLQQGGLLVVILDALQALRFNSGAYSYTGGTIYTVTNYDFLGEHFSVVCATGRAAMSRFWTVPNLSRSSSRRLLSSGLLLLPKHPLIPIASPDFLRGTALDHLLAARLD